jgi:hypothetical protein
MSAEYAEYNESIDTYNAMWNTFVTESGASFLATVRPTAIGWKVTDIEEFTERYTELLGDCDQTYVERLNGRLIAKMHLAENALLHQGISIVKVMQRRPQSTDEIGLDHVDFYCPDMEATEAALAQTSLHWTNESNGPNHPWISIWFEGTEAKLLGHTVLDVAARNLQDTNDSIVQGIQAS